MLESFCTITLLLLLIISHSLVAAENSTSSTEEGNGPFDTDFSNNVFTDLGPIIALFGEKFAQQFLSEAYSIWDCVVFAMAPLGIIPTIVAGIRVAGPLWMRALIGRARESRGSVELEVMSSTSRDVGELWNGEAIVRSVGRPSVAQLVLIRNEMHNKETCGLYTLQTALKEGKMTRRAYHGPGGHVEQTDKQHSAKTPSTAFTWFRDAFGSWGSTAAFDTEKHDVSSHAAEGSNTHNSHEVPNISINLHAHPERRLLVSATMIGAVLQAGVLAYSGAVTFHPWLRSKVPPFSVGRDQFELAGFVLLVSGTGLLTFALIALCRVIETSTFEQEYRVSHAQDMTAASTSHSDKVRLLWLQREHSVGDQQFDAAVLIAKDDDVRVLTSERCSSFNRRIQGDQYSDEEAKKDTRLWVRLTQPETIVISSTGFALIGFILQFQGFRYINWSCSLVQLGAIFVMTVIRAFLRRGLVARPKAIQVEQTRQELDRLTKYLMSDTDFFGKDDSSRQLDVASAKGMFMSITSAYHGHLRGSQEADLEDEGSQDRAHGNSANNGSSSFDNQHCSSAQNEDEATTSASRTQALSANHARERGERSKAIRTRLTQLTQWKGLLTDDAVSLAAAIKVVLDRFITEGVQFEWVLDLPGLGSISQYTIVIGRGDADSKVWLCKGLAASLEAVISLWLFDIKSSNAPAQTSSTQSDKSPDEHLWLILGSDHGKRLASDIAMWTDNDEDVIDIVEMDECVSGLRDKFTMAGTRTVQEHAIRTDTIQAPMVEQMTNNHCLGVKRSALRMKSANLEVLLAQHLFSNFMWSVAPYIRCSDIKDVALTTLRGFNRQRSSTWQNCTLRSDNLSSFVDEVSRCAVILGNSKTIMRLVIPALSWHNSLSYYPLGQMVCSPSYHIASLEDLYRFKDNAVFDMRDYVRLHVLPEVLGLLHDGCSTGFLYAILAAVQELLSIIVISFAGDAVLNAHQSPAWMRRHFSDSNSQCAINDLSILFSWQRRESSLGFPILTHETHTADPDSTTRKRLFHLFRFSRWHSFIIFDKELSHERLDLKPRDLITMDILGWTPLHYAVAHQRWSIVERHATAMYDSDLEAPRDFAGRTPLYYAAVQHHKDKDINLSIEWNAALRKLSLLKNCAPADYCGMTPLHWAARTNNHRAIAWPLSIYLNLDMRDLRDRRGRTPSHWAAMAEEEMATWELHNRGWDSMILDNKGKTPLHYAAENGRRQTVLYLIANYPEIIDARDSRGATALRVAQKQGHDVIVLLLLRKGANPMSDGTPDEDSEMEKLLNEAVGVWQQGKEEYSTFLEKLLESKAELLKSE
ncbi:hypothetical protein ACN47E_004926 [Coniothyrium glycines]